MNRHADAGERIKSGTSEHNPNGGDQMHQQNPDIVVANTAPEPAEDRGGLRGVESFAVSDGGPVTSAIAHQMLRQMSVVELEQGTARQDDLSVAPVETRISAEPSEQVDSDIWPARRAKAFFEEPSVSVQAYVPGFIYAGSINALVGAAKVGKTTLTWSMLDCAMRGAEFLGQPCASSRVLYISEQSSVPFRAQMSERLPKELSRRITSSENFILILPEHHKCRDKDGNEHPASTWQMRLDVWKQLVANPNVKPDIVVLDTFNSYADFQLGGENDNGVIANRLFDLNKLRAIKPSLSILILHHVTKAAETKKKIKYLPLSAIRGGGAFAAGADHIVTLNRTYDADGAQARTRYCYCQSRMAEERKFNVIWLPDGSYREVSAAEQSAESEQEKAAVQRALDENPDASLRQLEQKTGVSKSRIQRWHLQPTVPDSANPKPEG